MQKGLFFLIKNGMIHPVVSAFTDHVRQAYEHYCLMTQYKNNKI